MFLNEKKKRQAKLSVALARKAKKRTRNIEMSRSRTEKNSLAYSKEQDPFNVTYDSDGCDCDGCRTDNMDTDYGEDSDDYLWLPRSDTGFGEDYLWSFRLHGVV